MAQSKQFCTFFLAGQCFGVPVQQVQEVIRYQEVTDVPLVSQVIRGLINLRGQIVIAIDLRLRMGMGERSDGRSPMNIVVRTRDGPVSLLVDEIGEVIEIDDDVLAHPPETLRGVAREVIQGVHTLPDRLLLVLDTESAVSLSPVPPAAEERKS